MSAGRASSRSSIRSYPTETSAYTMGLTSTGPLRTALASAADDQSNHTGSCVETSSRTLESTSVPRCSGTRSAPGEREDLVGAHAGGGGSAQSRHRLGATVVDLDLPRHDGHSSTGNDEVDVGVGQQSVALADGLRDGDLALRRDPHGTTLLLLLLLTVIPRAPLQPTARRG